MLVRNQGSVVMKCGVRIQVILRKEESSLSNMLEIENVA